MALNIQIHRLPNGVFSEGELWINCSAQPIVSVRGIDIDFRRFFFFFILPQNDFISSRTIHILPVIASSAQSRTSHGMRRTGARFQIFDWDFRWWRLHQRQQQKKKIENEAPDWFGHFSITMEWSDGFEIARSWGRNGVKDVDTHSHFAYAVHYPLCHCTPFGPRCHHWVDCQQQCATAIQSLQPVHGHVLWIRISACDITGKHGQCEPYGLALTIGRCSRMFNAWKCRQDFAANQLFIAASILT